MRFLFSILLLAAALVGLFAVADNLTDSLARVGPQPPAGIDWPGCIGFTAEQTYGEHMKACAACRSRKQRAEMQHHVGRKTAPQGDTSRQADVRQPVKNSDML